MQTNRDTYWTESQTW